MLELGEVVGAAGVAMGVDVDHADGALLADGLEDRVGDRVVAADRERHHAGVDDLTDAALDVLMAELEPVAAAERHVADVGNAQLLHRGAFEHVVVGADALDGAQGARAEARARAVGDAEIHRHADHRHLQVAEVGIVVVDRQIGRGQEGRDAGIGCEARAALGEDLVGDAAELRIEQIAAMALAIFLAQLVEFFDVETHDRLLRSAAAIGKRFRRPPRFGARSAECSPCAYGCFDASFRQCR